MHSIPNFTIGELVSQSFGTSTHRGRRESDKEAVLIKTVEPGPTRAAGLETLRHEFRLLRQIELPGVPKALSLETFPGGRALVLEAAPGEVLGALLSRGRLPLKTALAIGVALADVLGGLHRSGVLYKRLSSASVLCDLAGPSVHFLDFSSASPLTQEPGRTAPLVGDSADFAYISPEQTGRMNRTLDTRSDLYSLGVILYELLAGQLPFANLTEPLALIHAHIARRPRPLREVAPAVPEVVSRIVDRLLAKTAEERYQTAKGLRHDLARCLDAVERGADVPEFALGSRDKDGTLRLPQRLYGRDAETATLLAAFDRVHGGAAELLLVSGYSGVGKSMLIREVNRPIAERGGVFISGKFEQFNRGTPYAALGQALRELVHLLLCESQAALAEVRGRIQEALGPNGRLLIDLVPDLALVVGPQPELPALTPVEAQHRLDTTLRRFVRAIGGPARPVVLFLDDLQWIDPATLHLVHALLTDDSQGHLLIVGAYRDNEVDSAHLLTAALDTLRKSGVALTELQLQPLGRASVVELLADALDLPRHEVEGLAGTLLAKTQGNPFFLGQYLAELCTEGLLRFDEGAQRWTWDMARIDDRVVAENVVELVTTRLRRLPEPTQQIVTLAAAIGHQFDAATLATISGGSVAAAVKALWPALEASVIVPLDERYRFLADAESAVRAEDVRFKFIHDRVQQAAYALTQEERLPALHLEIGRLLLARHGGYAGLDPALLFEAARHLGRGAALITDPEERVALARLDLNAGRRAKAASAYEAAAGFLAAGMALLDDSHWSSHYDLMYGLHLERGACEHMNGRIDVAEPLFEQLVPRVVSDFDFADLCTLRATLYTTEARYADVIVCCQRGLARLGVNFPDDPAAQQTAFMAGIAEVPVNLAGREVAALVDAPVIEDPRLQRILALLGLMTPASFITSMTLFGLGLITQVNLSLKHGHTDVSAYGYVSYGFLLIVLFEQYALAYEFGRLGLALNEKFQNTQLTCQLHVVFAMGLHFRRPLREALELNRKGYRAGLEYGDMNYSAYGGYASLANRLVLGDELTSIATDAEQYIKISTRAQEVSSTATMTIIRQVIANLLGETEGPQSLSGGHFDEADFRARQEADIKPLILGRYYIFKLIVHYLRGDYYNALAEGERAEHLLPALAGLYESTLYTFYMGLTLAALARVSSEEHRQAYADRIGRLLASLTRWAESCPQNFAHQEALLRAEMADLTGSNEATELYRLAIEAATHSEFVPDQALANRLAARHQLARGRQGEATAMMLAARRGYARWGATALVTLLDDQHRGLMYGDSLPDERYIRESEPLGGGAASPFDALMVLRVAQTLAGEIVLSRLIEQIMRTVMIHAGARRGLLILEREGQLVVEAMITHDPDVVQLDVAEPVEGSELLAASIVHYVARTRETVVLGDASRVDRFAGDRHIERYKPKSVLCLALTHQGRLIGLLYLENNLATNVFAAEQVDLIRMLSSHAAISVQNALLYANVERMTAELRASNAELLTVNQRLQAELVERERSERERSRLQDEVIQVQQARLAELSTPLIPITDKIMVMPIIGTVDQSRASRVVEAALAGAHQSRAAVVILDVTGLKHVDTSAINSLMQTAQSLRLLGTAVVITGVRSDMAQTLVNLGIDLGAMVVRGTLQSGIAYALERVGDKSGAFGRS